jgi:hypothetical protein
MAVRNEESSSTIRRSPAASVAILCPVIQHARHVHRSVCNAGELVISDFGPMRTLIMTRRIHPPPRRAPPDVMSQDELRIYGGSTE